MTSKNEATYIDNHCSLAIIYLVNYIWLKGHERTRSMMNIMFTLLEKGLFSEVIEGVN